MAAPNKLQTEVQRAVREALIASIREDRSLTVDRLISLRKDYPEVGTITVGELLEGEPAAKAAKGRRGAARTRGASKSKGKRKSQAVKAKKVDTRSAAGRAAYDASVIEAVAGAGGDKISAQQIRRAVGGTPEQARRALNRLIATGQVDYTGKARATRYFISKKK